MTKTILLIAGMLVAVGCKKGDGLVVVTVTATPTIAGIDHLHIDMAVGTITRAREIGGISTVDDSGATTFGIDVSLDFGSAIMVSVQALDSSGRTIGVGSAASPFVAGKRTDITVSLSGAAGDMGVVGQPDLAAASQCTFDNRNFDNCVFAP